MMLLYVAHPIVLMMLPWAGARARARARRTAASSAQLGLLYSLFGAFGDSLHIARFQGITEAPPGPSLCASGVLLTPDARDAPPGASKTT